ncbi:MAG: transporter substrate-binding domain-containing protein [Actinomycetota bacterium]
MRVRTLVRVLGPAVAAVMLAAACGQETTTDGESPGAPQLETIQDGVLIVASCLDFPPFESVEDGVETGFDVDLTEAIAGKLGLEVEWLRIDFDTIFTAAAGGQFDMGAAAITATGETGEERATRVAFSDFYFNSRQSLTVNTTETPDIASTDDLGDGDVVGVQRGTTGKAWAEENLADQGVQFKTFQAAPDAFRDLEAGAITAVVNDEQSSAEIITDLPSLELVEAIDTDEKYAFAFSQDNPELVEAVNQALQEIIDEGTYEEIFAKYFPGAEVPPEFQAA